ncbi:tetratricopeptide repeat protein [Tumebacillus sp. DT12]|uniref:Tetratricopeptide repeat protein n=1 Tax=Tumebacillus lacus TaxID=2995335 RepID=A0ABT3X3I1_9BACL|nr:tetratricopeptide repeat protein [Tumebacillus lacus]MCX7570537.1 tetratricopeptide repeat protein [Tumebacillus lacus]
MFSLGQRIRELRLKQGLTQIDLAKELCTPSMISQIESDKARPSYKMLFAIAERLDVPLEKLLVDVDLNMEYVSTYKMARAMVRSKRFASAIPLLRDLLETPRAQISTMDILFELGVCLVQTNELAEAEQTLTQVQELAIMRQDHQLLAAVWKELGEIEFRHRRYQLAVHHWQKALANAEQMDEQDVYLKAELLYRMGQTYNQTGQAVEALELYDRAARMYESMESLHEMAQVYLGLGISYQQMNDHEKAAEYSERAASIFEGLENVLMTIKTEIHNASLYAQTGRVVEAEEMLMRAIHKLSGMGDKEIEGIAYAELAQVFLCKGDMDQAEAACQQARMLLPELHLDQAKINRTLGEVALCRGQTEEAIRRLQMAVDGYRRLDAARECEETMYRLAQIYRSQGEYERQAEVLEKMRDVVKEALGRRGIEL